MKTYQLLILLCALFLLPACECEDLTPSEPETPQTFVVRDAYFVEGSLNIDFDRPVADPTFALDQTVFVESASFYDAYWYDDFQSVEIFFFDLEDCGEFGCRIELTIVGDEMGGVRSAAGDSLDGNGDGIPGDNYVETFVGF